MHRLLSDSLIVFVLAMNAIPPAGMATEHTDPADGRSTTTNRESGSPASDSQNATSPPDSAVATHTIGVIVAENVMLANGRIRTWEELLADLRTVRNENPERLTLNFRVTQGAFETGRLGPLKGAIETIDQELVRPIDVRIGRMQAWNSERFDAVQSESDLAPKPEQIRRGTVRTANGRPVRTGQVFLIRQGIYLPPIPTPEWVEEFGLDEISTRLDREGNFEVAAPDPNYWLAVVTPVGFSFGPLPDPEEVVEITLSPAVTLHVESKEKISQRIGLFIRPDGLPVDFPGFSMINVEIGEKPLVLRLPAGDIMLEHVFEDEDGVRRFHPYYSSFLKSASQERIVVAPLEHQPLEE